MRISSISIIPSRHRRDSKKCDLFIVNEMVINIKLSIVIDRRVIIRIEIFLF